jgi:hypothetical protein
LGKQRQIFEKENDTAKAQMKLKFEAFVELNRLLFQHFENHV